MTSFPTIGNGKRVVSVANHAVSLVNGSTPCNRVDIRALDTNVGPVVIGDSSILPDLSNGGMPLEAGEVYNIELITDLLPIFINAANANDGVTFVYWLGDRN